MKRILTVLLVICMGISFCACGEKKDEYFTASDFIEEEVEEVFYKIGDTVSTDRAAFTFKTAAFAESVWFDTWEVATPAGIGDDLDEKTTINMCVSFEIENVGETVIDDWMYNKDGVYETKLIEGYVKMVHEDYVRTAMNMIDKTSDTEYLYIPVGEKHQYNGYYILRRSAYTDDSTLLYLEVKLPNSKGEFETFKYRLR